MGSFILRPGAESDPPPVARAVVSGDKVGPSVAFDFLVPDVDSRSVPVQVVPKDDVVLDRFLDQDAVAAVAVADIKKSGAVDRVRVDIDAVHVVSTADIGDGVHPGRHVAPDPATVVAINVTTVHEERIGRLASLGV